MKIEHPKNKKVIPDVGDSDLLALIEHNATSHFRSDSGCPLEWEPSGSDFLSPCLQVEI